MNISTSIIAVVICAIVLTAFRLWTGKNVQGRITAIIALEALLIAFALTVAAVRGSAVLLLVTAAWLVQAGMLLIVLTKIGESLKADHTE